MENKRVGNRRPVWTYGRRETDQTSHEHRDVVLSRGFVEEGSIYQVQVAVCSVCGRVLDPFGVVGEKVTLQNGSTIKFVGETESYKGSAGAVTWVELDGVAEMRKATEVG